MRGGVRDLIVPGGAVGGGGITNINVSAGTTSNNLSNLVFADSNGVTFGLNGSTITASVAGGGGLTNIKVSAGTTSNLLSAITFADANGISFGLNASTITASHNGLTSQSTDFNAITLGGNTAGTTTFHATNNRTIFLHGGNNITLSGNGSSITISAFNQSVQTQMTGLTAGISTGGNTAGDTGLVSNRLVFAGGNNITLSGSTNGQSMTITVSGPNTVAQSNQTVGLYMSSNTTSSVSSGTVDARSMTFRGMGIASVGYSGGEVVISVPPGGGAGDGGVFIAAGTRTAVTNNTVLFETGNGITFGLNAVGGSVMTASHNGLTSQSTQYLAITLGGNTAGTTTFHATDNQSIFLHGGNNVTLSGNGSSITISAFNQTNQSLGIYASSQTTGQSSSSTYDARSLTIVGDGPISVGWSNSSLYISGYQYTMGTYMNRPPSDILTVAAPGQNQPWFAMFRLPGHLSASTGEIYLILSGTVTSNQTNTVGATLRLDLYRATGTQFTSFDSTFSTSFGMTFWNSGTASVSYSYNVTSGSSNGSNLMTASVYGFRKLTFNIGSTLSPGLWAMGYVISTSSAGNSSVMRSINMLVNSPLLSGGGFIGSATNGSLGMEDAGPYSTTSNNIPTAFAVNQLQPASNLYPLLKMGAY